MQNSNPFTILFGIKPGCFISRVSECQKVIGDFEGKENPSTVYMLTGIRGSGKTVLMTELSEYFESREWIVIDAVPTSDIIDNIVSRLAGEKSLEGIFKKADINVSVLGINIGMSDNTSKINSETILRKMLDVLKKSERRILITIDEVANNEYIRNFVAVYQNLIRKGYPIFLLMTGLYDNIYDLQNEKQLTFLYRAPKIFLKPLDIDLMTTEYKKILNISLRQAREMALLTKGYSFAFQMLGYIYWDNGGKEDIDSILPDYDYALREYSYDKIWSELSEKDKEILDELSKYEIAKVKDIREKLNISSAAFSVYRGRLYRKGLIDTSVYGSISLVLPRFKEFLEYKLM